MLTTYFLEPTFYTLVLFCYVWIFGLLDFLDLLMDICHQLVVESLGFLPRGPPLLLADAGSS